MKGRDFIQAKQIVWANRHNIKLVGSKTTKGFEIYTTKIDDNLFQPLLKETIRAFSKGDGGELITKGETLPKMQALHSSSVLGVNIFQYWKTCGRIPDIAFACGFCSKGNPKSFDLKFEQKFEISKRFDKKPNVDVVLTNSSGTTYKAFGIECKFAEAYSSRKHSGLSEKYINDIPQQWNDIPNLCEFAKRISPDDNEFKHLHPAQLIKHILGMKKQFKKSGFRLLYLWYDVYGPEGAKHREEIEKFKKITDSDNIHFHSMTYQELIIKMTRNFFVGNKDYLVYMTDRYL